MAADLIETMPTQSRKTLVTGGAGFIGSHVAEAYLAQGDKVWIVDDLSTGRIENVPDGATFLQADVGAESVRSLIVRERFDLINHHAAQINVRTSVTDPVADARTNLTGLLNILEAAREVATERFVFASSGGVIYGEAETVPTPEGAPKEPLSPYGVAKLTGEYYLNYYRQVHGLEYVALRYSNVYGPRQDPMGEAGVISIFASRLQNYLPLVVYGDGEQTRDFIHVDDVVDANLLLSDAVLPELSGLDGPAFHVGTSVASSVNSLASTMEQVFAHRTYRDHQNERAGELRHSVLNTDKIRQMGWAPRINLATGLANTFIPANTFTPTPNQAMAIPS